MKNKSVILSLGGFTLRRVRKTLGESLYVDIHVAGKRHRESLGREFWLTGDHRRDTATIHRAKLVIQNRAYEMRTNQIDIGALSKRKTSLLTYFRDLAFEKVGDGYRRNSSWRSAASHLVAFVGNKDLSLSELNKAIACEIREFLVGRVHGNTARLYLSHYRCAVNCAIDEGILAKNPFHAIKWPKNISRERTHLTRAEVLKLESTPCLHEEVKKAFILSIHTGLRLCDVRNLTWENVCENSIELRQRKTGKLVIIPLNKTALSILSSISQTAAYVFSLPRTDNQVRHCLHKWIHASGIQKSLGFHSSRHTYAALLMSAGADISVVSRLLGHQSIATTMLYAHSSSELLRDAVLKLDV